ncbi:hypothetical protein H8356DRAFT_1349093 [Neocallimastix lanati (nom. inval.)]|nr:hypothetical protein H8356DRAFT_1349093 [Neocallimastix sp. JGI-2020a]
MIYFILSKLYNNNNNNSNNNSNNNNNYNNNNSNNNNNYNNNNSNNNSNNNNLHIWVPISHMAIQLLINCKLRRSQSSLHTARRCIPNVPTYISNDHEHQNGTINSSLVGVIIGDWKFYNHQGLCFNSKRSIRDG